MSTPSSLSLLCSGLLVVLLHSYTANCFPGATARVLGDCDASLDLFVSEGSVEELSLSAGTLSENSTIFILKNGTSQLLSNGSLQVSETGKALVPIPPSIDDITFSLSINNNYDNYKVRYQFLLSHSPENVTELALVSIPLGGIINDSETDFDLSVKCKRESPFLTLITVQLNLTLTDEEEGEEGCSINIQFILQKDCSSKESVSSSSLFSSEAVTPAQSSSSLLLLSSTILSSLTYSLSSLSVSQTQGSSSLSLMASSTVSEEVGGTETSMATPIFRVSSSFMGYQSSTIGSSSYEATPSFFTSSFTTSSLEATPTIQTTPTLRDTPTLSLLSQAPPTSSTASSLMVVSSIGISVMETASSSIKPTSTETTPIFSSLSSSEDTSVVKTISSIIATPTFFPTETTPSSSLYSSTSPSVSVTPTDPTSLPWMLYVAAFGPIAGFLALCILIVCCCLCYIKCAKKKGSQTFADDQYVEPYSYYGDNFEDEDNADKYKKLEAPISVWTNLHWGSLTCLPLHTQTLIRTINIDRRKVAITSTFLRGTNGCLNRGILMMDRINPSSENNIGTVMKIMTGLGDRGHRDYISHFIDLTTSMQGLDHPNILPLLGLSIEDNCVPIALYPLTEYGNLHFALEMCRLMPDGNPLSPFLIDLKINFSYQLSSAMAFLTDKKVILQDLALRNCWLDAGFVLKLSDGALSQDFYPECYTSIKGAVRSVKWAAIETLQEGLITVQSNVWSFGVVVWEIFSVAKEPYSDIPNRSIVSHLMMDGRLSLPSDDCPDRISSLLSSCWNKRGEERPRFSYLHEALQSLNKSYSPSHVLKRHQNPSLQELTTPYSATTFGKESIQVIVEPSVENGLDQSSTPRHSNGNAVGVAGGGSGEWSFKRQSGGQTRRGGGGDRQSNNSVGTGGRGSKAEKISLSFSILDDDSMASGSDEDEEGEGSFPSTLKSRVSVATGTVPASSSGAEKAESLSTLQPVSLSPALAPPTVPPPGSPDPAASTTAESASSRSSIVMPAAISTDRSSFYSTGIDSVSTTFSTPLPHPLSHTPNSNGGMELKSYCGGGVDHTELRPQVMTTPFKSTDSGIRSDEESSSSKSCDSGHMIRRANLPGNHSNQAPPPPPAPTDLTSEIELRDPRTERLRDSNLRDSNSSHVSLGLGVTDFSSELMAAFDNFSSFKS